jgi:hypothetical protein
MIGRAYIAVAVGAMVFVTALDCFAGIMPSFRLENCALYATDIVVGTADAGGARFNVQETWRGNLAKGAIVDFPGLPLLTAGDLFTDDPRAIGPIFNGGTIRVVLFLKSVATQGDTSPSLVTWIGANRYGQDDPKVSAVWIDHDKAYSFVQVINPGPSVLISLGETEALLEAESSVILAERDDLEKAERIADPLLRAKAIEPMVLSAYWNLRDQALVELGKCGKPALPILEGMLRDIRYEHCDFTRPIAAAAGSDAGAEMTEIIREELLFWRRLGPKLPRNWRFDTSSPLTESYGDRFMFLWSSVRILHELKYRPAADVLAQVRDFWASLPQLNDEDDPRGLIQECDTALHEFAKMGKSVTLPQ